MAPSIKKKKCPCCEKTRVITKFHKNKTSKDGLAFYCRECCGIKAAASRDKNYDKYRLTEKLYYINNYDKIEKYHKKYYSKPSIVKKTKAYHKKYQEENKEKLREYQRQYTLEHGDKLRKKALEYYYENKGETRPYNYKTKKTTKPKKKK